MASGKRINGYLVNEQGLGQRYAGSYIQALIKGREKPETVYVRAVGAGNFHVRTLQPDTDLLVPYDDFSIVQEFPEMGAVNTGGAVHVLSRIPARQWSRGLASGLVEDFCRHGHSFRDVGLSHQAAKDCFDRVWISEAVGFPKLRSEELTSFARDTRYWFSGNKKHIYIWRNRACVGEVLGKKIFFLPKSCMLKQEIKDDLGREYEIV